MLNLTKEERLVVVFLVACFLIGSGVNFYKKSGDRLKEQAKFFYENNYKQDKDHPIRVNINRASFNELIKLKGIGEKIASRIIDFRIKNGPFFYKEDLMKVRGIGKTKFDIIKDYIIVK